MKILQIASGREINGALVYCQLLVEQLQAAGHELILMCRPKSWLSRQGLPCRVVESEMRRWPFADLQAARKWIRSEGIDVIHTHMSRAHSFGVLLKWLTGVPVVATAHNRYVQLHWPFNDFVIANSRATEAYHRRHNRVPADRIQTIHCFVDVERFSQAGERDRRAIRTELRQTRDEFVVGVIGEVIARKGQLHLAQALPELARRIPELRVVLIGRFHRSEKYVRRMRRIQTRHGLYRRVRWLGRRSNVHQHMAAMDVVLVPSTEEPFGLVAVEAQLAGTPVIATRVGGLPEIVQHERNGLLIPSGDPVALAAAVERIYRDRLLRENLVRQGREDAMTRFAPQRLTREVVAIYERLTDRSATRQTNRRAA